MIIRDAVPGDAAAIAAIWNPVIRDTDITFTSIEKTEADLVAMITVYPVFLVAEEDGALLGFATYAQFRGGPGYARTMEHTVYVGPAGQGKGLGGALVTRLEDHARASGVHTMIAGISSANQAAIAFHERLGYEDVAVLREVGWKFGKWFDLHLLQKRL